MSIRGYVLIMLMTLSACNPLALAPPPPADGPVLLLEVEVEALQVEALAETSERMAEALRANSISYSGRGVTGGAARIAVANAADIPRARAALAPLASAPDGTAILAFSEAAGYIEARLTDARLNELLQHAAETSAEVIRRRLSPNHPQSIPVTLLGEGRFRIRAPSTIEPDQLSRIATTPGRLSFHLVHDPATGTDLGHIPSGYFVAEPHRSPRGMPKSCASARRSLETISSAQLQALTL